MFISFINLFRLFPIEVDKRPHSSVFTERYFTKRPDISKTSVNRGWVSSISRGTLSKTSVNRWWVSSIS